MKLSAALLPFSLLLLGPVLAAPALNDAAPSAPFESISSRSMSSRSISSEDGPVKSISSRDITPNEAVVSSSSSSPPLEPRRLSCRKRDPHNHRCIATCLNAQYFQDSASLMLSNPASAEKIIYNCNSSYCSTATNVCVCSCTKRIRG